MNVHYKKIRQKFPRNPGNLHFFRADSWVGREIVLTEINGCTRFWVRLLEGALDFENFLVALVQADASFSRLIQIND